MITKDRHRENKSNNTFLKTEFSIQENNLCQKVKVNFQNVLRYWKNLIKQIGKLILLLTPNSNWAVSLIECLQYLYNFQLKLFSCHVLKLFSFQPTFENCIIFYIQDILIVEPIELKFCALIIDINQFENLRNNSQLAYVCICHIFKIYKIILDLLSIRYAIRIVLKKRRLATSNYLYVYQQAI